MSMFVEVNSVEKGCPVIINLEQVLEIAPLVTGGCALFFADGAGMNSKSAMKVTDSYEQFKQFAMQTVSAQDVADRIASITRANAPVEQKVEAVKAAKKLKIPKFDGSVDTE